MPIREDHREEELFLENECLYEEEALREYCRKHNKTFAMLSEEEKLKFVSVSIKFAFDK